MKDCWISNQERAKWIKEQSNLEHENTEPLGSAATTGWPYTVADKDQPYKDVDLVNSPPHYRLGKYEVIDVIEEWFPDDPHLFTAVQYLARAKHKGSFKQDLEKALWYINRRLGRSG